MPVFLHVGCGQKRKHQTTPGFASEEWSELRLDIDARVSPDVIGAMTDMSGVKNASLDAVFSSHNIEHLYPHEVPLALAEFRRVLRPRGFIVITCPDLQSVATLVADDRLTEPAYQSPAGPIAPIDILYGHRADLALGNHYMAHKCGFTERVLRGTIQAAGFARVGSMRRVSHFDLWACATVSPVPDADLEQLAKAHFPA